MYRLKAFIVMPFSEPYETIYINSILPALEATGFEPIRADQVAGSRAFVDDIEHAIRGSDIVLVEASEPNKNVYFEFGIARAHQKEVILLAKTATDLPSDTRHIRHLIYDINEQTLLIDRLKEWITGTRAFNASKQFETSGILDRGDLLPEICDAALYLWRHPTDHRAEIISLIKSGKIINPKFMYLSDRGTQLWLDLCSDAVYSYFSRSVQLLRNRISGILDAVDKSCLSASPDVVSLGPGNGIKDRIILRSILDKLSSKSVESFYYPFDISPAMIATAVRTVKSNNDIAARIRIKAAIADIGSHLHAFSPMYQYRAEPNIFLLLGNTLGNFDNETSILQHIRSAMLPGDYLLLEVRTDSSRGMDLGGGDELNRRFDFAPLELLGVPYNPQQLAYEEANNRSTVPGTKTIVATYDNPLVPGNEMRLGKVFLSCVHHYVLGNICDLLRELDYEIKLQEAGDGFSYLLVRRPLA